jgi:hypothetical protein
VINFLLGKLELSILNAFENFEPTATDSHLKKSVIQLTDELQQRLHGVVRDVKGAQKIV